MDKRTARLRRARKTRLKIAQMNIVRLSVFRTNNHIYAQLISPGSNMILAAVSTLQKNFQDTQKSTSNIQAAVFVGQQIAEKAKSLGIEKVAFDRSGFQYHGRIKALADAARENGLIF